MLIGPSVTLAALPSADTSRISSNFSMYSISTYKCTSLQNYSHDTYHNMHQCNVVIAQCCFSLQSSSLMRTTVVLIGPLVTLAALPSADTSRISSNFSFNSLLLSSLIGIGMTSEGTGSLSSVGPNTYVVGE